MSRPILRHIANLWTLMGHPSLDQEWPLEQKLRAIKDAGFDGVCWAASPELAEATRRLGLVFVGGMSSGNPAEFPSLLRALQAGGAQQVNVQLADHDTLTPEAVELTIKLLTEGERLGLAPAIETHRDTCTETPEKAYALADAFQASTGRLLPLSFDFSHFAVVKHLAPDQFCARLLVRPDLIRHARQFHLRPFNGHHAQVPVTDGRGGLTPEFRDWLPFAEAVLRCWLDGNRDEPRGHELAPGDPAMPRDPHAMPRGHERERVDSPTPRAAPADTPGHEFGRGDSGAAGDTAREIFVCPELGPAAGGYALSTFPNSWEDAKVLREELDQLWHRLPQTGKAETT